MLVINERTMMSRSERRVLDWMRTWTGPHALVGLAISGCYLPDRNGRREAQEADLVVITPTSAVVVEVKGIAPAATSGVLLVQANGRWRLSGFDGDPIRVREHDGSPFDQVTTNVFNLKELVRTFLATAFVDGLVVVVPPKESTISVQVQSQRHGCGVVLGSTPDELRSWFRDTATRRLVWSAERVHMLLGALNLAEEVTVDELVGDGFPREQALNATPVTPGSEDLGANPSAADGSDAVDASESSDRSEPIDPETSVPIDPETSVPIDPETSVPIAPETSVSGRPQSSPFTDQWSSWIETDTDRHVPAHSEPAHARSVHAEPAQARSVHGESVHAAESAPVPDAPVASTATVEGADTVRRGAARFDVTRRPRIGDLRRRFAVPGRRSHGPTQRPRMGRHRLQQIAAVVLIALVAGVIWLLSAARSTPSDDAVRQPPAPATAGVVVTSAPPTTQTQPQLELLPLCLPLLDDC
ncbi:nuclease-related domain-containing protein [Nocardia sp. CNY236]|uniref:nuclease-related domain-containing protein n=1 Tax=Nocardia sp. CNY236 TaxID=1169152 RepID=UPI00048B7662|nr:nuclease-related domain-containing protein [Nocardia sp. CNY236]